jgi:hypothetical protein
VLLLVLGVRSDRRITLCIIRLRLGRRSVMRMLKLDHLELLVFRKSFEESRVRVPEIYTLSIPVTPFDFLVQRVPISMVL